MTVASPSRVNQRPPSTPQSATARHRRNTGRRLPLGPRRTRVPGGHGDGLSLGVVKLLFAGDWHGDEDWAAEVLDHAAKEGVAWVVQVGDFGFGFYRLGDDPTEPGDWAPRCPFARHVSRLAAEAGVPVVFIDGNHDNHVLLARLAEHRDPVGAEGFVPVEDHLYWAPRGHRWEWDGVRFGALGGGYSADRRWRTKGLDFWTEEVTTASDVTRLGPGPLDVLVTHDGPMTPRQLQATTEPRPPQGRPGQPSPARCGRSRDPPPARGPRPLAPPLHRRAQRQDPSRGPRLQPRARRAVPTGVGPG